MYKICYVPFWIAFWHQDTPAELLQNLKLSLFALKTISNDRILSFQKLLLLLPPLLCDHFNHNMAHGWHTIPWQVTLFIFYFSLDNVMKRKHKCGNNMFKSHPTLMAYMEIKMFLKILSVTLQGKVISHVGYICLMFFHAPTCGWTISLNAFCEWKAGHGRRNKTEWSSSLSFWLLVSNCQTWVTVGFNYSYYLNWNVQVTNDICLSTSFHGDQSKDSESLFWKEINNSYPQLKNKLWKIPYNQVALSM